jgi:hypothetical protein
MISNMLKLSESFTTSTAFVFTITGAEVPQNIRIQIMTITGKICKRNNKDELGPLHIGRNITELNGWNRSIRSETCKWYLSLSCDNEPEWKIFG